MFTEMLFTIAEIRKQPKYLLMCKENVVCVCVCVYTYTEESYLAIKKNEILPSVMTWMDFK